MNRDRAGLMFAVMLAAWVLSSASCRRPPALPPLSSADSIRILQENLDHRTEVDRFFRSDPGSPFVRDSSIAFHGIRWYPIDPSYRATSQLHRFAASDTVIVMGTKGEARKQLLYGYFEFPVPGSGGTAVMLRLNVYKFTPSDGQRYLLYRDYLSAWFTDSTTGGETYGVGRYVDVGTEDSDPSHLYTIDLNMAYNPYCAYSAMYSCAIPRKDDRLDIALRVGEMKYHD